MKFTQLTKLYVTRAVNRERSTIIIKLPLVCRCNDCVQELEDSPKLTECVKLKIASQNKTFLDCSSFETVSSDVARLVLERLGGLC